MCVCLSVCPSVCEYELWLVGAWPTTASSNDLSATLDLVTPPSRVYDVCVLHKLRPTTPAQLCQCHLYTFSFVTLSSELIIGKDSSLKWCVKCWVGRRALLTQSFKNFLCSSLKKDGAQWINNNNNNLRFFTVQTNRSTNMHTMIYTTDSLYEGQQQLGLARRG